MLLPAATPVTIPVTPIVATPSVLLLHTPAAVALNKDVVSPAQTEGVPVIAATEGKGLTVTDTVTVVLHPEILVTV